MFSPAEHSVLLAIIGEQAVQHCPQVIGLYWADEFFRYGAIGPDEEFLRNSAHSVGNRNAAVAIHPIGIRDLELIEVLLSSSGIIPDIHPDEVNGLILVFQVNLGETGRFFAAGRAPRGPKIHQNHLTFKVFQAETAAVKQIQFKIGSYVRRDDDFAKIVVYAQADGLSARLGRCPTQDGQQRHQRYAGAEKDQLTLGHSLNTLLLGIIWTKYLILQVLPLSLVFFSRSVTGLEPQVKHGQLPDQFGPRFSVQIVGGRDGI